eukprot:5476386-Amphidinium_carterae.1
MGMPTFPTKITLLTNSGRISATLEGQDCPLAVAKGLFLLLVTDSSADQPRLQRLLFWNVGALTLAHSADHLFSLDVEPCRPLLAM